MLAPRADCFTIPQWNCAGLESEDNELKLLLQRNSVGIFLIPVEVTQLPASLVSITFGSGTNICCSGSHIMA